MAVSFRFMLRVALAAAVLCLTGLTGARAQEGDGATRPTRFIIEQVGQQSWLVAPDGRRFFSRGVCCVNQGVSQAEFDPANPGYAAWQHYVDSNQWARWCRRRDVAGRSLLGPNAIAALGPRVRAARQNNFAGTSQAACLCSGFLKSTVR